MVSSCARTSRSNSDETASSVPHSDFSDLYEKMSGKGASASESHRLRRLPAVLPLRLVAAGSL